MNKFILTLFSLILFTPSIFSETVLYCSDEMVTGEKDKRIVKFQETRFTLKFNEDKSSFIDKSDPTYGDDVYSCTDFEDDEILHCINKEQNSMFTYSNLYKRYTWFKGSQFGYIYGSKDTNTLHFGKCEDF